MPKALRFFLVFLAIVVALVAGFVIWANSPARPMPEALSALKSDAQVTVAQDNSLIFKPTSGVIDTGLIFYPGGRVDYRSYAPPMHQIAEHGYLVVVVHMPLNLAVLNPNAALDVISHHTEIVRWVIGGHLLGGTMAANFAKKHTGLVQGLVLWAAYPSNGDNLFATPLKVASISGTLDGLATPAKIAASRALLPAETIWTSIRGGNHAQFGWYGEQKGDNPATISRSDQQAQAIAATLILLVSLK